MTDRISINNNGNIPVGSALIDNVQNNNIQNEQNVDQSNNVEKQQVIDNIKNDIGLNDFINGAVNGNNLQSKVEGQNGKHVDVIDPDLHKDNQNPENLQVENEQHENNEVHQNPENLQAENEQHENNEVHQDPENLQVGNEQHENNEVHQDLENLQVENEQNNEVNPQQPQVQNQPVGKEWDFSKAEGLKDLVKNSYDNIRDDIKGDKYIDELEVALNQKYNDVTKNNEARENQLKPIFDNLKEKITSLKEARRQLSLGLPESSTLSSDPKEALAQIRKFLRVFRYETQSSLLKINNNTQKMGIIERTFRGIQNLFTFGINHKVTKDEIVNVNNIETEIARLLQQFNGIATDPKKEPVALPQKFNLRNTINDTLEISHRTNDQIRRYQQRSDDYTRIHEILGPAVDSGGSRKVEFTVGAGVLVGLGFPETVTAGVKAGARFTVTADVKGMGKGNPVTVTFRLAGGLEGKLLVKAGDEEKTFTGGKAQVGLGGQVSSFSTRTYASLDDLIADANRNKFATTRQFGAFLWSGVKYLGGKLGQLGGWIGRHKGDTLHSNAQYFNAIKTQGYIDQVDGILAKKSNAIILSEQTGWTIKGSADASAGMDFFDKMLTAKASISGGLERDFKVKSQFYAPVVNLLKNKPNRQALEQMLRNDPLTGQPSVLPNGDLEQQYAELIRNAKEHKPANDLEWQVLANKIRNLMIATEIQAREGGISRELAEKLQGRFSNPEIKIPVDIYREFFMEGSGLAKTAKIRKNFSASVELSAFKDQATSLTDGMKSVTDTVVGNIAKSVADGAIDQTRRELGLDYKVSYKFSSEKPANNDDPRPWENVTKTNHELVLTQNMPFNTLINALYKINSNHKKIETDHEVLKGGLEAGKTAIKDVGENVVRSMIVAGVKESAKAAVMKFLNNATNLNEVIDFITSQESLTYQAVLGVITKAAMDPKLDKQLKPGDLKDYVKGGDIAYTNEKTRSLKLSYVDGELETVTLTATDTTKFGISEEPLGVGLGVSFDLSLSVTENIKENGAIVNTSLTTLMEKTESLLAQSSFTSGSCEGIKTWMARNIDAVKMLMPLSQKSRELINQALELMEPNVRASAEEALNRIGALRRNSNNNDIVNAFHDLIVPMTKAFRTGLPGTENQVDLNQAQQPANEDVQLEEDEE
jgi:hypothetical protein